MKSKQKKAMSLPSLERVKDMTFIKRACLERRDPVFKDDPISLQLHLVCAYAVGRNYLAQLLTTQVLLI